MDALPDLKLATWYVNIITLSGCHCFKKGSFLAKYVTTPFLYYTFSVPDQYSVTQTGRLIKDIHWLRREVEVMSEHVGLQIQMKKFLVVSYTTS